MKALNFIFESNGLLYSQKIKLSKINDYKVDYYDFDRNTFSDFEDYIDFMNFSEYRFITLTQVERLPKFISYMEDKIDTKFIISPYNEFIEKFDTQEKQKIDNTVKTSGSLSALKRGQFDQILNDGYKSCICQLYPASFRKNLIKHIFIDNIHDIEKISETVLGNMAINSEFIFKGSISEKSNKFPFICNPETKFKNAMLAPQVVSSDYLYDKICNFISNGKITNLSPYIEDYGSITDIDDFHSLRIFNGSYYLDMQKERKLGGISNSYKVLINNYLLINQNNKFKEINPALLRLLPFLIDIEKVYGSSTIFVTPYNYYKLQKVNKRVENIDWIGFSTEKNKYVYSLNKRRLFEVSSTFLDSLEYIIKNQIEDSENKEVIEKVQEKLDNVE